MNLPAILLIGIGLLYLVKPEIFKRGVWLKTSIAQRSFSKTAYLRYMRGLGLLFVTIGLILLIRGK